MSKKIAIITGATGGIGHEFVKQILQEPVDAIWVLARNREKLEQLLQEFGERIVVYPADLSSSDEIAKLTDRLQSESHEIAWLVNNAGMARMTATEDMSAQEISATINLNCAAPVLLTNACLPFLGRGSRVLNVASAAAFQPNPYLNLYASSKAFLRSYSRSMNVELKDRGITVTAVCPSWVDTDMLAYEMNGQRIHFPGMVTAQQVVTAALKDAKRGKDMSVCSLYVKCQHLNVKLMPQRLSMKLWTDQVCKYVGK